MTPLSVVFRVDATDDVDARRQLSEVIATATRILGALRPPAAAPVPLAVDYIRVAEGGTVITERPQEAEPVTTFVHRTPDGKTVQRPWAPGQDGMGE